MKCVSILKMLAGSSLAIALVIIAPLAHACDDDPPKAAAKAKEPAKKDISASEKKRIGDELTSVKTQLSHLDAMISSTNMRIQNMKMQPGNDGMIAAANGELANYEGQKQGLLFKRKKLEAELN